MRTAPTVELTEKEWDAQLFNSREGLATMLGWNLAYHTLRSKGSDAGFPDRVIARERIIYAELKSARGKVSDAQRRWLDGLASAGGETYVWFPSDLDEIGNVLGRRRLFLPESRSLAATSGADPDWNIVPGSMWLPGTGRRRDGR